jgi:hypothetical protein
VTRLLAAVLVLAACSDITVTPGGVAAIELVTPHPAVIEVNQRRPLRGRAVDANGDSLPIALVWFALDTTLAVDSAEAMLVGRFPGDGRVLARAADLYSPPVRFRIIAGVDTIFRVGPEEVEVRAQELSSPDLAVAAAAGPDLLPVPGREVHYVVAHPVFADTADRTVEFLNARLTATATTGANGQTTLVRLRRRAGVAAPDSAVVTARLERPGGEPVPGSGLRFVVRFASP